MKLLFLLLGLSSAAQATIIEPCSVSIPSTRIIYEGYVIEFGDAIRTIIEKKGYHVTFDESEAESILRIESRFVEGGFLNKAQVSWIFNGASHSNLKSCLTQLCSIYDFRSALITSLKSMDKKIPACSSN